MTAPGFDLDEAVLAGALRPGGCVAVSDGAGFPRSALAAVARAAAEVGGVRLLLGWVPGPLVDRTDPWPSDVVALMAGNGFRRLVDQGLVRYLPCRLSAVPSLVADVLRPDVLVASAVRSPDGRWRFATEVGWLPAAVEAGATVAVVERPSLSSYAAERSLPADGVLVLGQDPSPAEDPAFGLPSDAHRAIAERVAALVPEGARLQHAPGALGWALLEALEVEVALDTGVLTDATVGLDRRGLLAGEPVATYLAGAEVQGWARGRRVLHRVEVTHDPARLTADRPFVAVNTALEVDLDGAVNVEAVRGSAVAGVGGQPDYAAAACRSRGGLSIVALPSTAGGRPTLVEALSAPASTASHDVEVVVTERGVADLRGLARPERRAALRRLWDL